MDTKTRAEKILLKALGHKSVAWNEFGKEQLKFITSQLDEAVREARGERDKAFVGIVLRASREGKRKGFAAAREKAAGIAENTWDYIPQETWDEGFEPGYELTQKTAAERIRAMKAGK